MFHSKKEATAAGPRHHPLTAPQCPRAIIIRLTTTAMDFREFFSPSPVQLTIPPLVHYGHDFLLHDGFDFLNNFTFSLVLFLPGVHNPRIGKSLVHFMALFLHFPANSGSTGFRSPVLVLENFWDLFSWSWWSILESLTMGNKRSSLDLLSNSHQQLLSDRFILQALSSQS